MLQPFYVLKMPRIETLLLLLQRRRRWPVICATHAAHAQEERDETNEDEEPIDWHVVSIHNQVYPGVVSRMRCKATSPQ